MHGERDIRDLPFEERYDDFEVAGEGGMGVVYMAFDKRLHRFVALKTIRPHATRDRRPPSPTTPVAAARPAQGSDEAELFADLEARFLHEAWVTGGLEHPGVVPVYELGTTRSGVPYYTMRFLRGQRTLKEALDDLDGAELAERLLLLEPFLRVCDTIRYAHSRGVIHRDLKPTNIVLGEFGEVIVIDWGLARFDGAHQSPSASWQERLQGLREAGEIETRADALGTPGYMAPEAALGRLDEVDHRSDVYSLGVILFEILTGRLPHDTPNTGRNGEEVPEALSALCARCLTAERSVRPASVEALSSALRSWQTANAVEREVEARLRDARTALTLAEASGGSTSLGHVDRAAGAVSQAASRRPDHPALPALRSRIDLARSGAVRALGAAKQRRFLFRAALVALVLVTLASVAVAVVVKQAGRRADRERDAKAEALEENRRQLERVLRLSDGKAIRDMEETIGGFAPMQPDLEARTRTWLERARGLASRRPEHESALADLRRHALASGPPWRFATEAEEWQHEVLVDLIARLDLIESLAGGAPRRVGRLHDLALRLREAEGETADAWQRTIEAVASEPRHGGLRLRPERGLVPLGRDPLTGLFEFAQVGTGRTPTRHPETGRLVVEDDTAVVLVLVPGGRFRMGQLDPSPPPAGVDPGWRESESPAHDVTVPPFLLARHECTQAQWDALTLGEAAFPEGEGRLPVGNVSWEQVRRTLAGHGLRLPSEAEWEYACRAGTTTHFGSGSTEADLARVGWYGANSGTRPHAVGEKPANAFGLHDLHGNAMEYCRDAFHPSYEGAPHDTAAWLTGGSGQFVVRGGGYLYVPARARSSFRGWTVPAYRFRDLGFRPARSLAAP